MSRSRPGLNVLRATWLWVAMVCVAVAAEAAEVDPAFNDALEHQVDRAVSANIRLDADAVLGLLDRHGVLKPLKWNRGTVADEMLVQRFMNLNAATFYLPLSDLAVLQEELAMDLTRRGIGSIDLNHRPRSIDVMGTTYWRLVAARAFDRAEALRDRHPGADWPRFWGSGTRAAANRSAPAMLRVSREDSGFELTRVAADIETGDWVVAVVHPDCGYSRAAMMAIEEHPEQWSGVAGRMIWITHPMYLETADALDAWNRQAHVVSVAVVDDERTWPVSVGMFATPVFHLLRDGDVVDRTHWRGEGSSEALLAKMAAHLGSVEGEGESGEE